MTLAQRVYLKPDMNKRIEAALEVLNAGGYFTEYLEPNYFGAMQFKVRLHHADGSIVKGVGRAMACARIFKRPGVKGAL